MPSELESRSLSQQTKDVVVISDGSSDSDKDEIRPKFQTREQNAPAAQHFIDLTASPPPTSVISDGPKSTAVIDSREVPTELQMEKSLEDVLAEGKDDHAHIVEYLLTETRRHRDKGVSDSLQDANFSLSSLSPHLIDSCSPLEGLQGSSASGGPKAMSIGKVRFKPHDQKQPPRIISATCSSYKSRIEAIPSYVTYTTLNRRILVQDDFELRYFPYFGDNDQGEDFLIDSLFENNPRDLPQDYRRAEEASALVPSLKSFLDDVGSSISDVILYLEEAFDASNILEAQISDRRLGSDLEAFEWVKSAMNRRRRFLPEDSDDERATIKSLKPLTEKAALTSPDQILLAARACTTFSKLTNVSILDCLKKAATSAAFRRDSVTHNIISTAVPLKTDNISALNMVGGTRTKPGS
ncbi:MAG: hypothetical protein M4579_005739 [Chaenotheca gracillima]|nr:MAG: hypothetical protein M4579_005739 [Chaenotheca gracillima]